MTAMRPPYQLELALPIPDRGEAPHREQQKVETITAMAEPENPASTAHLIGANCDRDDIAAALRVKRRAKRTPLGGDRHPKGTP